MKAFLLGLLLLCATLPITGCTVESAAAPVVEFNPKSATLRLEYDDGVCSGTAVDRRLILTAAHCRAGGPMTAVNGLPVKVLYQVRDRTDHVLVVVDLTFEHYAPNIRWQEGLSQGEEFVYWGNPLTLPDQFRKGYVTGYCPMDLCFPRRSQYLEATPDVALLSVMGQRGDSGAAMFNSAGEIIGVISLIQDEMPAPFIPMGALGFTFTAADVASARLVGGAELDAALGGPFP